MDPRSTLHDGCLLLRLSSDPTREYLWSRPHLMGLVVSTVCQTDGGYEEVLGLSAGGRVVRSQTVEELRLLGVVCLRPTAAEP